MLLCIIHASSSNEFADQSSWIIREFNTPFDIPKEVVRGAIMTNDGSVWLALWGGGIAILNGNKRSVIDTGDGLISNDVRTLEEDQDGRVWVGTASGISCIQNSGIINFASAQYPAIPEDTTVFAIKCMQNSEVWFGDGSGNLYSWTPSTISKDARDGTWKHLHQFVTEDDPGIRTIDQDEQQRIWVSVFGAGIFQFNSSASFTLVHPQYMCKGFTLLPDDKIIFLTHIDVIEAVKSEQIQRNISPYDLTCVISAFGKTFIGTEKGLYILENNQFIPVSLTRDNRPFYIGSLSLLEDDSLWVGTRSGAFRIVASNWKKQFTSPENIDLNPYTLQQNSQYNLFVLDRQLRLWQYSNSNWSHIHQLTQLPDVPATHNLFIFGRQIIILHKYMYLIFDLDEQKIINTVEIPAKLEIGGDQPVFMPNQHDLWLGGAKRIYNGKEPFEPVLLLSNGERNVSSITQISSGEIWVTGSGWIKRHKNSEWQNINLPESMIVESYEIKDIIETKDGALWFAMLGEGILIYQDQQWRKITSADGLPNHYIKTLFQSNDGTIWAGGRTSGILSYKDNRWVQHGYENGLPVGMVLNIVEDEQGSIWASINGEGIFKLALDHDVPSVEIESAPSHLVPDAQGVFSFLGYDAWNHTPRNRLVYSWQILNGANKESVQDWSAFATDTSALTQPMKPGNYIFEVIAQDEFRNSSMVSARVPFEVIPYFWMRYQFWIPVILSFIIIFTALARWGQKYRYLLWNQAKLKEDIVTVSAHHQQKLARELHDSIMRDCTGISIVSKGLLNKLIAQKSQYAGQVQMVLDCINSVSQHLRKIEKGLSPAGNAELGLIPSLRSFMIHIQSLFLIQCRCELDEQISFQNRQTEMILCQIAHEALFNAAKHASPQTIELLLKQDNNHVLLVVRDDGCGMNTPSENPGSGIQNMKHRADLIHAQLRIENLKTGGTQVTCTVPKETMQP